MIPIDTERLRIRRFRPDDLEALFQLLSDEAVMRYIEPPYSRQAAAEFLAAAGLCEPPLVYAVDQRGGGFVGYVIYHSYGEDEMEIGWILRADKWRRGYGDELTKALIRDAAGKARRLVIECAPQQTATRKLALRNGFVYRGSRDGCDLYKRPTVDGAGTPGL